MLHLEKGDAIAAGSKFLVFEHPSDPGLLVKVPQELHTADMPGFLHKSRLEYRATSSTLRELKENMLARRRGEMPSFLQTIAGFADTNLGFGFVVKAEREENGDLAPSLTQLARTGRFNDDIQTKLDAVLSEILASEVVIGDVHGRNLVYAHSPERGHYFVLVDGIGPKTWIPLQAWSSVINRRVKQRHIARLRLLLVKDCSPERRLDPSDPCLRFRKRLLALTP